MAPSIKLALANALKKLLQKKFLDDITVKELVEECEVNRQVPYYHFQDICDLLRWFLEHETSEALRGADCWQDVLWAAFHYVQGSHLAIYHVYRPSGRDHLDCHFFSLARAITASTLAESARDLPLPGRELDFLADFHMYAIAGMMMGWLSGDTREKPEEIVGRLNYLLEGEFHRAAEKFSAGEPVSWVLRARWGTARAVSLFRVPVIPHPRRSNVHGLSFFL